MKTNQPTKPLGRCPRCRGTRISFDLPVMAIIDGPFVALGPTPKDALHTFGLAHVPSCRCLGCGFAGAGFDFVVEDACWESETFTCDTCGKDVPWGQGAADNHPDTCDDCVHEMHKAGLELSKAKETQS